MPHRHRTTWHGGACGCRWGHKAEDTLLALGVDDRVLAASRMTRPLLESAAAACGGIVLHGFPEIHTAFRALAYPRSVSRCSASGTDIGAPAHACAYGGHYAKGTMLPTALRRLLASLSCLAGGIVLVSLECFLVCTALRWHASVARDT